MSCEYTYYAQCRDTTRIKIGVSVAPKRRIAALNSGSSTLIELLAKEVGGREVEQARHVQFREARVPHLSSREWFYPVPPLLNLIQTLGGAPATDAVVPEAVDTWFQADLRARAAESALQGVHRERAELQRSLEQVEALHDLVYAMMRIRHGIVKAAPHAPRGARMVSERAVAEARELVAWLSPAVASRMDAREIDVHEAIRVVEAFATRGAA